MCARRRPVRQRGWAGFNFRPSLGQPEASCLTRAAFGANPAEDQQEADYGSARARGATGCRRVASSSSSPARPLKPTPASVHWRKPGGGMTNDEMPDMGPSTTELGQTTRPQSARQGGSPSSCWRGGSGCRLDGGLGYRLATGNSRNEYAAVRGCAAPRSSPKLRESDGLLGASSTFRDAGRRARRPLLRHV